MAEDPTRFVERGFTWIENKEHSVRLIDRNNSKHAISIAWVDLPSLRELIVLALGDGKLKGATPPDFTEQYDVECQFCDFKGSFAQGRQHRKETRHLLRTRAIGELRRNEASNNLTERQYSGELWIDEDGMANFKWHIGGGSFPDAREALVKFIECLTHRLQNEENCPFYTAPEQVGILLDAWELLSNDVKSDKESE